MDTFCKFLSDDLFCLLKQILSNLGFASSTTDSDEALDLKRVKRNFDFGGRHLVTHPSYTIRHEYPGPLITYDGEERCEPRLIRFSDLNRSTLDLIFKAYKEENDEMNEEELDMEEHCEEKKKRSTECKDPCKKKPRCKVKFQEKRNSRCQTTFPRDEDCFEEYSEDASEQKEGFNKKLLYFIKTLFPKRKCLSQSRLSGGKEESSGFDESPPTKEEIKELDNCAKAFYEDYILSIKNLPSWESLKPAAKLRFQWKALTGEDLKETPYENFSADFTRSFREAFPAASDSRLRIKRKNTWYRMDRCQRLPFILQALLYQVAIGALDPEDHCAVRELFHKLR
ncbi:uncharacterized protein [Drosophila takahashii]|uniref:uncharacterized protein n=1 Tax=Drosophila takahashii TaxID=29030 RepID=UPI001CF92D59|nr:uncharacterized protein LOC108059650 [Drosophila takahashii]